MSRIAAMLLLALVAAGTMAAPTPVLKTSPLITVANAKDLHPLRVIPGTVTEVVWGPKRGELTLLPWESSGKVLDAATYTVLREVGAKKRLIHLAFAPGGDKLAWCENTTRVEIHNLKAKKTAVVETGNDQPGMQFSPDGKLLATGGYGTRAKLWDAASGALVRSLDMGPVVGGLSVVFSPDGKRIAVGNRNHTTRLFEAGSGKLLHELDRRYTQELKFSPDGKTLAVAYVKGEVGLWDVTTGNLLRSQATGAKEVYTLDWGRKSDVLATAGLKGKIILWRAADLTKLKELDAPPWVIRVRFSPDRSRMITAGGDELSDSQRKVIVWGLRGK